MQLSGNHLDLLVQIAQPGDSHPERHGGLCIGNCLNNLLFEAFDIHTEHIIIWVCIRVLLPRHLGHQLASQVSTQLRAELGCYSEVELGENPSQNIQNFLGDDPSLA